MEELENNKENLFNNMDKEKMFQEFSLAIKNNDLESLEKIIEAVESMCCKQQFVKEFKEYCKKLIEEQKLENVEETFDNQYFSIEIVDETLQLEINGDADAIEGELINKYINTEKITTYPVRERLYKILQRVIKSFENSSNDMFKFIQTVMPVIHFDRGHTFYGYDLKDNTEYNVAVMLLKNYKDCLADWFKDFTVHFADLTYLVMQNTGYIVALSMCYHRTKALCRKLYFAIDETMYNIDTFEDKIFAENENYEEIKSVINSVDYNSLQELRNIYKNMYEDICELGDLLFMYKNQYEGSVRIITPDDKQ